MRLGTRSGMDAVVNGRSWSSERTRGWNVNLGVTERERERGVN